MTNNVVLRYWTINTGALPSKQIVKSKTTSSRLLSSHDTRSIAKTLSYFQIISLQISLLFVAKYETRQSQSLELDLPTKNICWAEIKIFNNVWWLGLLNILQWRRDDETLCQWDQRRGGWECGHQLIFWPAGDCCGWETR